VLTATRPDRKVAQILSACTAVVLVVVGIKLFHTFGPIHEHNDGPLSVGAAGMALVVAHHEIALSARLRRLELPG